MTLEHIHVDLIETDAPTAQTVRRCCQDFGGIETGLTGETSVTSIVEEVDVQMAEFKLNAFVLNLHFRLLRCACRIFGVGDLAIFAARFDEIR